MVDVADGRIQCHVGPTELGAADDLESVVVEFIAGAQRSLDVAVQELGSEPVAQALLDARERGVSVDVVLEQDYLRADRYPRIVPRDGETVEQARLRTRWQPAGTRDESTRRIVAALLRCGIDVHSDLNRFTFHHKFVVRDYRGTTSDRTAVLTGSANFTPTDFHRNLNHVLVFHDHRIAKAYRVEYEQLRAGEFGRQRHGAVPRGYNLGGVPVKVLFAPDHTPELEIMKQILKAADRIDFAVFTFAGSSGIDDALLMAGAAGRRVRGILDPGQGVQQWAATQWLHGQPGIELLLPRRVSGFGKLHHKLMVIDDATVVAGSMNYTAPGNEVNDENIFVLGTPHPDLPKDQGGPPDLDRCREVAAYFRAEIDRIAAGSVPYRPRPPDAGPDLVLEPAGATAASSPAAAEVPAGSAAVV